MSELERLGFGPDDVGVELGPWAVDGGGLRGFVRRHRWELAVYGLLLALALGTRLWDVGGRTLHYDELLHAWYSWLYSGGSAYHHTPLTHGPFLFHVAAGSFWLFGASDVTVRLIPALFGVALVGLPFLLRRELGRFGAVATAVLFLASPTLLYFGRFVRNDIYMAVWAVLLVAIMWRYMAMPRRRLLFAWIIVWAFAFTTKETSYFLAMILGFALFWMSAPHYVGWVRGHARLADVPPPGALLLVLTTITLPLWAPLAGLVQHWAGVTLVNVDPNDPRVVSGELVRIAAETGAPAGGGLYIALFLVIVLTAIALLVGLAWNRRLWLLLAATFAAIWVPLYTSLFSQWQGFFTGLWGSLGYWMAQQPVERAGQPWYYYFLGLAGYEFLVLIPGLAGAAYLLWRGNGFDRFLVYFAVMSVGAGVYAGEKMPWLLVGLVVPIGLVAGRSIGQVAELVASALASESSAWRWWRAAWQPLAVAYGAGALLTALIGFAVLRVVRDEGFLGAPLFWLALLGAAIAIGALVRIAGLAPRSATFASGALGALTLVLLVSAAFSARASYSYAGFERPSELLAYSQTGQETTYAAECIARVAKESGLGADLRVLAGESDNFAWQWRWYLRDYPNVEYRFLNNSPLTAPPAVDVVIFSKTVQLRNEPQLTGFTQVGGLSHLWWFPNTAYSDLSVGDVLRGLTNRQAWRAATDYFFSRSLGSEPYRSQGLIYVADRYAGLAQDCTALRATPDA